MECPNCRKNIGQEAIFCKFCGTDISSVQSSLISSGYIESTSSINNTAQIPAETSEKQSFFSKIGGIAISLIALAVIYGAVNGVMWFGQEVYHHEDNVKLEQTEAKINQLKVKLESFESSMQLNGVSDVAYKNYEKMLAEHNKLIEEYNALAKESGTRWYVVPVPTGHSKPVTH